jgi:hypothetical protein
MAPKVHEAAIPKLDVSKLGIISGTVQDGPNKVFVGGKIILILACMQQCAVNVSCCSMEQLNSTHHIANSYALLCPAGLHYHLAEDQVLELLQAFGKVKSFHLVKNDPDSATSKGYCFVEYADSNVTRVAVIGLNGMDLGGGKTLTARVAGERAGVVMSMGTESFTSMAAQPNATPRPDAIIINGYVVDDIVDAAFGLRPMPTGPMHFDQFGVPLTRATASLTPGVAPVYPSYSAAPTIPGLPLGASALDIANAALDAAFGGAAAVAPLAAPASIAATRILVLHNMVSSDDLATDEEYKGLLEEVEGECAKYGKLIGMKVPRGPSTDVETSAIKKIFLEYATPQDAQRAEQELAGRQFGPSVVQVSLMDYSLLDWEVLLLLFLTSILFALSFQATYFRESDYLAGRLW